MRFLILGSQPTLSHQLEGRGHTVVVVRDPERIADAFNEQVEAIVFGLAAPDTAAAIFRVQQQIPFDQEPPLIVDTSPLVDWSLQSAFGEDRVAVTAVLDESLWAATDTTAGETFQKLTGAIPADSGRSLRWSGALPRMFANVLPGVLDMSAEDVLQDTDLLTVELAALQEAQALLSLAQIDLMDLPGAPAATLLRQAQRPLWLSRGKLRSIGTLFPATVRDELHNGNGQTTAPWLNGAVAALGDSLGRFSPVNHTLALLAADIATQRAPWSMYRGQPEMVRTAVRAAQGMSGSSAPPMLR
ncbi:MAG: hypothetical protein GYB64_02315 [Chloroflexi bacterium]|nr:hypothetical protein [Chloroflexota bacterium]